MLTLVHVTHEAVHKMGGIGSVLEGLITAHDYTEQIDRTILLCPLFTREGPVDARLGPEGEVLYSSVDGRVNHPLAESFRQIQSRFHVDIVYGRRILREPYTGTIQRPEVILIDVTRAALEPINELKFKLFDAFGLASTRYETSWDYEQYVRLAEPGLACLRVLGAAQRGTFIVAHEFMGLPTALAAKLHPELNLRTIFHAHEVAPIRRIVEDHPGHDTMFYNVLRKAAKQGLPIDKVFGDQFGYFRHALVVAARHLDMTFAVGDEVVREMRFLGPDMARADIRLTYNGIPAYETTYAEAATSKARIQDYLQTLLGDRPDYIFTHVTRLVPSKGLWRDIGVMKYLDEELRKIGKSAVLIVLSTEIGGPRARADILNMEREWDWPVGHREGMPDLTHGEAVFYAGIQAHNARARNAKILFINQFGFDRETCGDRMPANMQFWDIRQGSDVEFGQSVYEPFGIAQLEALSFGALCVMSSVCGCAGFVEKVAGPDGTPNVIIADYTNYKASPDSIDGYKAITRAEREAFDDSVARSVATEVMKRLPRTPEEKAAMIRRGFDLAQKMSWDVIASDYVIPAVRELTAAHKIFGAA